MEQYRAQQPLFQEASDEDEGEQPWEEEDNETWEPRRENCDVTPMVMKTPETEETENEGEYRILKDNQLWEKQDKPREESRGKQDEPREESGGINNGEEALRMH